MGNVELCGNGSRNAPAPFYYPINASVQQEQWQRHVTRLDDLDSGLGNSLETGRTLTARSESSISGIGDAQLLEKPLASAVNYVQALENEDTQEHAGSGQSTWRGYALGCAVTMVVVLAACAGCATLASAKGFRFGAGTSASQLHLPKVHFPGTPREQLLSGKEERTPDTSSACCRGPQARCRACEAALSVAEYCQRQQRPVHVAGCEEFEGDGASVRSSEESEKEEAEAEKARYRSKHILPQRPSQPAPAPELQLPTSGPMPASDGTGTRCCTEETARCVACNVGMSVLEYCSRTDAVKVSGCEEVRHSNKQHRSTASTNSGSHDEEQSDVIAKRKAAMVAKLKERFAEEKRKEEHHEMQRQEQLKKKEIEEMHRLKRRYDRMPSSAQTTTTAGSTEAPATTTSTLATSSTTTQSSSSSSSRKANPTIHVRVVVAPPTSTPATTSTIRPVAQTTLLPTLFCFSLMLPWGYEPGLLKMQLRRGRSIFACDATEVYSSEEIDLGGLVTVDLGIDLHCPLGGVFHTVMNTPIFLEVWRQLISAGRFRKYQWTVKADPDAVFFPERLRKILTGADQANAVVGKGIFLNNCGFGLHGPLEVVSNRALEAYGEGSSTCKRPPQEDVYLQQCLIELGVTQVNHFNLLAEDHCAFKDWEECSSGHVSFHPFKKVEAYERCLDVVENSSAVS